MTRGAGVEGTTVQGCEYDGLSRKTLCTDDNGQSAYKTQTENSYDVHIDIRRDAGKCCCTWVLEDEGIAGTGTRQNRRTGAIETGELVESWHRRIMSTVDRSPAGFCIMGAAPVFGIRTVTASGAHPHAGKQLILDGGVGSYQGCAHGIACGKEREVDPTFRSWTFERATSEDSDD